MPSDANGNYSLPNGYLAVTGTTVQPSQHNPPLEDLAEAMTGRLPKNGAAPMTGPIKLDAGTEGLPGLTFATGPGTGLYKTADGIGVAVNGAKVAEFSGAGLKSGGRYIGELIPFTTSTVPPLTVLPAGQTLSRTAYPELWALAQAEIAAGNTFYNNGNGSTTFGIGDLRGRVLAGRDDMGGAAAGRLSAGYFGGDATKIGATGGAQWGVIGLTHLPPYTPTGTIGGSASLVAVNGRGTAITDAGAYSIFIPAAPETITINGSSFSFNGGAQGGGGNPFSLVQHTLVCNFLLFAGA
ncbi:phage tail protein [Rubrivivax sp. JA1024]|nr:phage tail protein [Rubrivivax sp. JA1024]